MSKARDIADLDFNSPDIDGGNIDGASIGNNTPDNATFTNVVIDGGSGAADLYINNSSPTLGFTDSNSFTDPNDIFIVRGLIDSLGFQWFDNSANSTTTVAKIDKDGTAQFDGTVRSDGGGILAQGGSGNAYLQVGSDTGSWTWKNYRSNHKLALEDSDGTGEVLSVATNGEFTFNMNVGIGIDPAEMLDIKSTSGDARIRLDAPTGSDTEIKFFNNGVSEYTIGHNDAPDRFVIGTSNVDNPLFSITKQGQYFTPSGAQLVRQIEIPYNVTGGVLTYTFEFMNLSNKDNDTEGSTANSAMFFVNVNTYLNKYIHMVVTTDLNAGNSLAYQTLGSIGLTGTASIDATNPQITISISGMWGNSSNYSGRITASQEADMISNILQMQGKQFRADIEVEVLWEWAREIRDAELQATDFWALQDRTMTESQRTYRQELRDFTDTYTPTIDENRNLSLVGFPSYSE